MSLSERDMKLIHANQNGLNISNQYENIRNQEKLLRNVINVSNERNVYGQIQVTHTFNKGNGLKHKQYFFSDNEMNIYLNNNKDAIVKNNCIENANSNSFTMKESTDIRHEGDGQNSFRHREYNLNVPDRLTTYKNSFSCKNRNSGTYDISDMTHSNISGNLI